jgi:uncharacterized ferritin-like protein (DUF455 family)
MDCLRTTAQTLFLLEDPAVKAAAVQAVDFAHAPVVPQRALASIEGPPGRPLRPQLVAPRNLPRRALSTPAGRAALVHALAHIEFNAINLALDAVWRFAGMPEHYYREWFKVACDEARHFTLLAAHLARLGFAYGDFDAHDGLWEIAHKTRNNVLARMALVPRLLEARGLDASPLIRDKLQQAGDAVAAQIVQVILQDEVSHVATGNHWFRWLCDAYAVQADEIFDQLAKAHRAPRLRGPFNLPARRAAGFTEAEIERLVRAASIASAASSAGT